MKWGRRMDMVDAWSPAEDSILKGLGSNLGEDMGVLCLCGMGGVLKSRRAASPLMRLVEGEEKWEASEHPQGILPQN
ncbi:hypothetical protein TNCV_2702141 [Trichonephila clavipes]|nr:hypothetical protein TNCV_2702141 [Trichonephila clavipes]